MKLSGSSIMRWRDILVLSTVGSLAAAFGARFLSSHLQDFINSIFGESNSGLIIAYLTIAGLCILLFLHRATGIKLRHLKYWMCYPPLPFAVIISILTASLWPVPENWAFSNVAYSMRESVIILLVYFVIWLVFVVIEWIPDLSFSESIRPQSKENDEKSHIALNDLDEWLRLDEPISKEHLDFFDHKVIARSIYQRLQSKKGTIALLGNYGSGKSSVCRMVRSMASQERASLLFVETTCWGFDNPGRVQQMILEEVLKVVGNEVDCFGIRSLPSHYLQALKGRSGWFDSTLHFMEDQTSPVEQLRRLSPILSAINKQVVIIIEDMDRNGEGFDLSQIQSLLMQVRQVDGLSFILAISPDQDIDFLKTCDFLEMIPPLPRTRVLTLVKTVRDSLLEKYPPGILVDQIDDLTTSEDELIMIDNHATYHWSRERSLYTLLSNPRILKATLARVAEVWPKLAGEVRIDDVISLSTLRIAAPDAFRFFQKNFGLFRSISQEADKNMIKDRQGILKASVHGEWIRAVQKGRFDENSAANLIEDIYPASYKVFGGSGIHILRAQSMGSSRRGTIYARRLFTESLGDPVVSDQDILSCLSASRNDLSALRTLAEMMTDDKEASDTFEEFASALNFNQYLPLLSEIYAVIRERHGPKFSEENHPGFSAPSRHLLYNQPVRFDDWLINEIRKCIPGHLRQMYEIYYCWLDTNSNSITERISREAIFRKLKEEWQSLSPEKIAKGFDPSFPYTLFHLVFTRNYRNPEAVPLGKLSDWTWLRSILWNCCRSVPSVFVPEILMAMNRMEFHGHQIPRYEFNEEMLTVWLGDHQHEFMKLVSVGSVWDDGISVQTKYLLNLAVERAKEWLAKNEFPDVRIGTASGKKNSSSGNRSSRKRSNSSRRKVSES